MHIHRGLKGYIIHYTWKGEHYIIHERIEGREGRGRAEAQKGTYQKKLQADTEKTSPKNTLKSLLKLPKAGLLKPNNRLKGPLSSVLFVERKLLSVCFDG